MATSSSSETARFRGASSFERNNGRPKRLLPYLGLPTLMVELGVSL